MQTEDGEEAGIFPLRNSPRSRPLSPALTCSHLLSLYLLLSGLPLLASDSNFTPPRGERLHQGDQSNKEACSFVSSIIVTISTNRTQVCVNNSSAAAEGGGWGWGVAVEAREEGVGGRVADRWEHQEEGRLAAEAINSTGGGGRGINIVSIQLT